MLRERPSETNELLFVVFLSSSDGNCKQIKERMEFLSRFMNERNVGRLGTDFNPRKLWHVANRSSKGVRGIDLWRRWSQYNLINGCTCYVRESIHARALQSNSRSIFSRS